jgi:hypothetical protein
MSEVSAVQSFLARLKPLLETGALSFNPRNARKTWQFMLAEGLTEEDAYAIIAKFGPEHYQWGPCPDDDGSPGDVILFYFPYAMLFHPFDRILLYIKLKIWTDFDGKDAGIVMSFHEEGKYD